MHKRENSQLLIIKFNEYITHQQGWPIVVGNKESYFLSTLALTDKCAKHYFMLQKNNCNTIRPLLPLKRLETGKICMFWQLPHYPDLSNQKLKFLRNRLRKQLLPTLKMFFNPQVENVLLQFAKIIEAEDCYISKTTSQLIKTFAKPKTPLVTFEREKFFSFTPRGTASEQPSIFLPTELSHSLFINFLLTPLGCNLSRYKKMYSEFVDTLKGTLQSRKILIFNPSDYIDKNKFVGHKNRFYRQNFSYEKLPILLKTFVYLPCIPYKRNGCILPRRGIKVIKNKSLFNSEFGQISKQFKIQPNSFLKNINQIDSVAIKKVNWGENLEKKKDRNWFITKKVVDHNVSFLIPLCMKSKVSQHLFKNRQFYSTWIPRRVVHLSEKTKSNCFAETTCYFTNSETKNEKTKSNGKNKYIQIRRIYEALCVLPLRGPYVETEGVKDKVHKKGSFSSIFQGTAKHSNLNLNILSLMKKDWAFQTKNRQIIYTNVENLNPPNLFFRFSMPIRTTYWIWNRKLNTNSRWNNSFKTEIECALLNMSIFTSPHNAFPLKTFSYPENRAKRNRKKRLELFRSKNFLSDSMTTPKSFLFGEFYNRKMNNIFLTNFFIYFDTLEMEKKEIYWPIIISFFPIALQRRVVKLFLTTRNWKKVRYSHIENFLAKKKDIFKYL